MTGSSCRLRPAGRRGGATAAARALLIAITFALPGCQSEPQAPDRLNDGVSYGSVSRYRFGDLQRRGLQHGFASHVSWRRGQYHGFAGHGGFGSPDGSAYGVAGDGGRVDTGEEG